MRELIENILVREYKDFTIWHIEETWAYCYVRFTSFGETCLMTYYKPNESYEIFKLIGGVNNAR